MDLKDTILTHDRWFAIFSVVMQGTFDNRRGESVTEFVMDNKLGDPDSSTGENFACNPFKHPRFMANDFEPDSNNEASGGLLLDRKRWILLDLEGHVYQKRMSGFSNISNLTIRVGDLERMVGYLQTMRQEPGELMMSIVDGSIPVACPRGSGSLGTTGTVTRANFEGYKAEHKRTLAILAQKIGGVDTPSGCLCLSPCKSQSHILSDTSKWTLPSGHL